MFQMNDETNERNPVPASLSQSVRARGMTLVEMMVAMLLAVAAMGSLSLLAASLRDDTPQRQTQTTLTTLHEAMRIYSAAHDAALPAQTHETLQTLLADERSAAIMRHLPFTRTAHGLAVLDGFGRPIRYLPPTSATREGDFVSAGPDGRFGDPHHTDPRQRAAAMDNLYASDQGALR